MTWLARWNTIARALATPAGKAEHIAAVDVADKVYYANVGLCDSTA